MQFDAEDIIKRLGIESLPADEQEEIIDTLNERIGASISMSLTEQQINEYQAIIDGRQVVIDAWLDQNLPNYKDTEVYKEVLAGFESDPEKVPGDKVVASIAWVEKNVPNKESIVAKAIEDFSRELSDSYGGQDVQSK